MEVLWLKEDDHNSKQRLLAWSAFCKTK